MPDEAPRPEPLLKPWTIVLSVLLLVGGLVAGILFYYPDQWPLWRRAVAGLLTGSFAVLLVLGNRYIGRSEVV